MISLHGITAARFGMRQMPKEERKREKLTQIKKTQSLRKSFIILGLRIGLSFAPRVWLRMGIYAHGIHHLHLLRKVVVLLVRIMVLGELRPMRRQHPLR